MLNDPMEGSFRLSRSAHERFPQEDLSTFLEEIATRKYGFRICSLSLDVESPLLWAHYASEFRGLAIEVELRQDDRRIRRVDYHSNVFTVRGNESWDVGEYAQRILCSKLAAWEYEQEVRIIQTGEFYDLRRTVRSVVLGPRMSEALSDTIRVVCRHMNIPVRRLEIDGARLEFIDLDPLHRPRVRIPPPAQGALF